MSKAPEILNDLERAEQTSYAYDRPFIPETRAFFKDFLKASSKKRTVMLSGMPLSPTDRKTLLQLKGETLSQVFPDQLSSQLFDTFLKLISLKLGIRTNYPFVERGAPTDEAELAQGLIFISAVRDIESWTSTTK